MSQFSDLLKKAAAEVRAYSATAPGASQFGADWFLSFAEQLEAASAVESDADVERQIDGLLYMITDSGPLTAQFCSVIPSGGGSFTATSQESKTQVNDPGGCGLTCA